MPETLLIAGGRVIDPSQRIDQLADLLLVNGKIAELRPPGGRSRRAAGAAADSIIDASGKIVSPGLIDMHVHLREPGSEDAETIASGAAAAVAGGFSAIVCMPNTNPALDTEAMIEFVYRQAVRAGLCNVYPVGAITKGRAGNELAEMGQMVRAGAVGFSDDGRGVADSAVMYRAMQYAAMFNRPIIQHCEDASLAEGGCMNAGPTALRLGLPGIPAIAEEVMLQRDLHIAQSLQAPYHMAHVSTAGAVRLLREAKRQGLRVTTEVCPHHLLLTDEGCHDYDTHYKVNPPLRTREDVEACLAGVVDGTIDCLVTDHAPHGRESKELDFQSAPFGIASLELALGLFVQALVTPGRLTWPELIHRMSTRPAQVLGLPKGTLAVGRDADVTIIDPELEWRVDSGSLRSKSRNSPYHGWTLRGRTTHTLVAGRVRYQAGEPVAAA